jgi:hypothetical protein
MKHSDIIKKVANELNLSEELVSRTYDAYWKFIRESISELPLKEDLSKDTFDIFKTNFNIPSIGKLSCNYQRYIGVKKQFKKFKDLKNVYNKED